MFCITVIDCFVCRMKFCCVRTCNDVIAPRLGCAAIVVSLMHAAVSMYLRTNILYVCMWGYVTLQ